MPDQPVILTRDEDGTFFLHIRKDILNNVPKPTLYVFSVSVANECLKDFWGYDSSYYENYRCHDLPVDTVFAAKEVAANVRRVVLALTEKPNPEETEQVVGEIDF